jgi:hypothetical protein
VVQREEGGSSYIGRLAGEGDEGGGGIGRFV